MTLVSCSAGPEDVTVDQVTPIEQAHWGWHWPWDWPWPPSAPPCPDCFTETLSAKHGSDRASFCRPATFEIPAEIPSTHGNPNGVVKLVFSKASGGEVWCRYEAEKRGRRRHHHASASYDFDGCTGPYDAGDTLVVTAVELRVFASSHGHGRSARPEVTLREIGCGACTPTTCAMEGVACGDILDGCGGTLSCGTCAEGEACDVLGQCVCVPSTCDDVGATCGAVDDGCGGEIECGECSEPDTCGGGGVANQCGCTPVSCSAVGADCDVIADGCGSIIDCGECDAPQTCGGAGVPNACGCTPSVTCDDAGAECGDLDDGCGATLDCGTCEAPETCGGGGVDNACGERGVPPDPATVAGSLDTSATITLHDAIAFLFEGDMPIQYDVAPGIIVPERVALIRGLVTDTSGAPMSGVTVAVLGTPEYGHTMSRADGMFDLALNGGGTAVTVVYSKPGYLPIHRQVGVDFRETAFAPDVVMTALDPVVTTIALDGSSDYQVALSSVQTDEDGARAATLLFPPGVGGTIRMPDGSVVPVASLDVRATEYTVGERGAKAMPAALPTSSGYTYAVELSADEALAAGAVSVDFDAPVYVYVDNFLGFPVGMTVPVGYYDRQQGQWIAAPNGRVIEVLDIVGGVASVDVDGDGLADTGSDLDDLGFTSRELEVLATLHQPGDTLWRTGVEHFTPWDCNWPYGPPPGGGPPGPGGGGSSGGGAGGGCQGGSSSVIECFSQALGETVPITGTPFDLTYDSRRTQGYGGDRSIHSQILGDTVNAALLEVHVEITVAGQRFRQSYAPTPNLRIDWNWDGKDAYGRTLTGTHTALVVTTFDYEPVYVEPGDFPQAFGRNGNDEIAAVRARGVIELRQRTAVPLTTWDARPLGLGDWMLDIHHIYDVAGGKLFQGNGLVRSVEGLAATIETVAGNGTNGRGGDGASALASPLSAPDDAAFGPSGDLYFSEWHRIRRIDRDGNIFTVAGVGSTRGFSGDGGPGNMATLAIPRGIAFGPDGSLFVADSENHRVRRIAPDGIITTYAGSGPADSATAGGFSGDGGPATSARLNTPMDVAVAPDGTLYIADTNNHRVRRVDTNGIITTFAGNGSTTFSPSGVPPTSAGVRSPIAVEVASTGRVLIATGGNTSGNDASRILNVDPDGSYTSGLRSQVNDVPGFGPAQMVVDRLALDRRDNVYIASFANARVWRIGQGARTLLLGATGGQGAALQGFGGDGGPAQLARVSLMRGITVGPDNRVYIVDTGNFRIRAFGQVDPRAASAAAPNILVPSEDAREVYVFNLRGLHLSTIDVFTGAVLWQFDYDARGRLVAVTDVDGKITTLDYDASGIARIVAPFGQVTELSVDPDGCLARMENPAGEQYSMSYEDGCSLSRVERPRGEASYYSYDATGRLVQAEDTRGQVQTFLRQELERGHVVTHTTGEGRVTTYEVTRPGTVDWRYVVSFPNGTQNVLDVFLDGRQQLTRADGTTITTTMAPDPRFGMQGQLATATVTATPGGRTRNETATRVVTGSDPSNPLLLSTYETTQTVNGRATRIRYDAATRLMTHTSPAGRITRTQLDARARIVGITAFDLTGTTLAYNNLGQLETTAAGARQSDYTYDADGYVDTSTDAEGHQRGFAYDLAGRVTEQTLEDTQILGLAYDQNGNLTGLTPPGSMQHTFSHDGAALMTLYAPPNLGLPVESTSYLYNLDRQLTHVIRPDGVTVVYAYHPTQERITSITDPRGTTTVVYDSAGRIATLTAPDGGTLTYGYDGRLVTSLAWGGTISGVVSFAYDPSFRLQSETAGGSAVSFGYDQDDLLTSAGALSLTRRAANGLPQSSTLGLTTTSTTHTSFGELASATTAFSGTPLYSEAITARDNLGRIVTRQESTLGDTVEYAYVYHPRGWLTDVYEDGAQVGHYEYDPNGNRIAATVRGSGVSATYDAQDRLTSYGDTTYTYGANGELESKTDAAGTTLYQYDVFSNLTRVDLPDGAVIEYVTDAQNRRIGKRVNGALVQGLLYRDQLEPVVELDGAGNVVARFVYGSMPHVPDYVLKGGATYRYVTDHLGSVRLVVNTTTGAVAQRLEYDEFGRVLSDSNPGFQPFGFAGGIYDGETGLVRFGARDYDPEVGRWTSKDPIRFDGGQNNLYSYLDSDAANLVDPNGMNPLAACLLPPIAPLCVSGGQALSSLMTAAVLATISCMESDQPDEDEGPDCNQVRNDCIEGCLHLLPDWDLQSLNFQKCVSQCMQANDC